MSATCGGGGGVGGMGGGYGGGMDMEYIRHKLTRTIGKILKTLKRWAMDSPPVKAGI